MKNIESNIMPKPGGISKVRAKLEEIKRKTPSPELVDIIDDVTSDETESDTGRKEDIAAKPTEL